MTGLPSSSHCPWRSCISCSKISALEIRAGFLWSVLWHFAYRIVAAEWRVLSFQPKYRLSHPEKYFFSLSKKIFSGSEYPKNILFNFENRSTAYDLKIWTHRKLHRHIAAPNDVLCVIRRSHLKHLPYSCAHCGIESIRWYSVLLLISVPQNAFVWTFTNRKVVIPPSKPTHGRLKKFVSNL